MLTLLVATLVSAAQPQTVEVQTLTGHAVTGSLVDLNDERIVVQTAAGPRTFAVKELLALSPRTASAAPARPTMWIELTDQSQLTAVEYTVAGGKAKITRPGGEVVELPAKAVAIVRFREQTGPLVAQWADILKVERSGDLIVIRKNDALDYLTGVIKDITPEGVQFELDGDLLPVKRPKVEGLIYHAPAAQALPDAQCVVSDAAGGRVQAKSLALADGKLRVTSPAGVELSLPLTAVIRVDYGQGNLQYLSDLKPELSSWSPYVGESAAATAAFYRPRTDRALEGGPLRLAGKRYAKGLALHSRTELVYRLPEKFSRFQTTAGIDERMRGAGHVRLLIAGDDRTLLDQTIAGKDPPRAIDLDIQGVNRLKITVDFGEDLDVSDHLDLCEARILK